MFVVPDWLQHPLSPTRSGMMAKTPSIAKYTVPATGSQSPTNQRQTVSTAQVAWGVADPPTLLRERIPRTLRVPPSVRPSSCRDAARSRVYGWSQARSRLQILARNRARHFQNLHESLLPVSVPRVGLAGGHRDAHVRAGICFASCSLVSLVV